MISKTILHILTVSSYPNPILAIALVLLSTVHRACAVRS
ncbi:hypothetical protein AVDCRST_MAG81-3128 [uncultured Synechococcales cyanobacterium]|uniref:Uncharacterized protein n=1 Tax=uncultured Synechococcales cyanobacterium TaxID=1936017 RepID=A0A6J4VKV4_9CYAN|nr:hypothetical protein AVDCRST_MAG81-3128 [uncultured Synechococcales cyanobacterium]